MILTNTAKQVQKSAITENKKHKCPTKFFNTALFFSIASAISLKASAKLISEFDHNLNTGMQSLPLSRRSETKERN